MFKKVKGPEHIVGHRLKGVNAKRDPLLDEQPGTNKRSRQEDGSASVVYKETPTERAARLKAEREAEKELKRSKKPSMGPSKASLLGLPETEAEASEAPEAFEAPEIAAGAPERSKNTRAASHKEMKSSLADFKDRLKTSQLPEQAAAAEQRHREELEAETAKALAAKEKREGPDADERLTMNEIWKAGEGGDEEAGDWLGGEGLKFHTTADKAFAMANQRHKQSEEEQIANREQAAALAKKRSEQRIAEMQQLDYWGGCTMQAATRHCKVNDIKDIPSLMMWLTDDFVPLAFTDRTEYPSVVKSPSVYRLQDGTMHWTPRYVGDTKTSILIGTVRMRQLRVQYSQACSIIDDLQGIVSDCFADYSDAVQSTLSWAPAWTPEHLKDHYTWMKANITEQRPIVGRYATYPGDGFVMDLGLNMTGGQTRLRELQYWQWVDSRTRAFIIELNTINPNVNSFVHSRILFEFPAAGGVLIRQEVGTERIDIER
ncbi:unnamed protein product [Effrenium voratum]|nr:unnamed protein product [Effrenium voratum]